MADQKYVEVSGGSSVLYNGDTIVPGCCVVLVEGVFDALAVEQQVGDRVVAVATGSTTRCRQVKWIARLALAERVLVAFDADEAGEEAAAYWLKVLPNAERWRPWWDDPNQLMIDGVDLRTWLMPAFQQRQQDAAAELTNDATLDTRTASETVWATEDQPSPKSTTLAELENKLEQLLAELGGTPGTGMEFARQGHPGYETYRRFVKLEREWKASAV